MTKNTKISDDLLEVERQGVLSRIFHSIRTRCSLMTAVFLLLSIGLFYIGSRIVFIHFVRDAESQLRHIGSDISRTVENQSAKVRRMADQTLAELPPSTTDARQVMQRAHYPFSVIAGLAADGRVVEVCRRLPDGSLVIDDGDCLENYRKALADWIVSPEATAPSGAGRGIVRLGEALSYVAIVRHGEGWLLFGLPFEADVLGDRASGGVSSMEIRVSTKETVAERPRTTGRVPRVEFGLAPMFSEAMEFYSGGFWKFGNKPFSAVYSLRDIAGDTVSTVSVSIPRTFVSVTRMAVGRLGFIVALIGLALVLPLFWLQGRVMLNPLTRMTRAIADIGRHNADVDCPRLEWKGKDEFAQLALSVNRMLETISSRSLAVAQAEARHKELINSLPDELLVFDSDARFISIMKESEDDCQLPGLYPGEPLAENVYGAESVQRFKAALELTLRTGQVGRLRLQVQRPLGASRSLLTRHFEVRLVRIDEYFALAMVADTTEEVNERNRLRIAEARVAESKKRESLTVLAAGIAHDMNNVLSVVLNAAESDRADPSGDSANVLATIRDAVRRGAGMMRELQAYAGENRVSLHRLQSRMIVDDIRLLAERLFPRTILVSYDKSADAPDVDADPNQFWKVLFNIAKNAGEAIGPDRPGHIVIGCARMTMTAEEAAKFISEKPLPAGVGTVFTVRDDGPGIRADLLPRLFDPYVSSKAVGRGLGLATVRTIIEEHGGGIRVTSQLGAGSLFEIYLPESKLPPETTEESSAALRVDGRQEVLIVDDDVSILRTTSILLKAMKLVAHVAKDNAEALAVVRRRANDLRAIILDADLGGVDTVRLLASFRASAPSVPVIVSTGSAEERIRELFAPCPYDHFLSKPYTLDELKRMLACAGGAA